MTCDRSSASRDFKRCTQCHDVISVAGSNKLTINDVMDRADGGGVLK